ILDVHISLELNLIVSSYFRENRGALIRAQLFLLIKITITHMASLQELFFLFLLFLFGVGRFTK
ncbi:hypothetical protein R0K05_17740, partial [Planococcus sp. SIMBA_160]